MKADLHIHSRVSDGSSTISELAEAAAAKGLDVIAVTDHDTLSHWKQIPEDAPVRVLCGLEISCCDYESGKKVHILGYQIQNDALVEKFVHPVLEARHENSLKQIGILKKHGYEIDAAKLHRADGKYIYKQHIMEYLVSTGQAPDMFGEFYRAVFKNGGICDFDIHYLNPHDVEPYSIVVGVPTRKIRMRFPSDVIQGIESTRWWTWDHETLARRVPDFCDIDRFLQLYARQEEPEEEIHAAES